MIFVTVGTHEQQFDRLVECMDRLKCDNDVEDEIIIQTGYSTYNPKYCSFKKLFPYKQMIENVANARIVITHGGPSSFIMPLQIGKIPIVVPRRAEFGEHVNNHQVDFCNAVAERQGNLLVVDDIEKLPEYIKNYDSIINDMPKEMQSNNERFNRELEKIVDGLMRE